MCRVVRINACTAGHIEPPEDRAVTQQAHAEHLGPIVDNIDTAVFDGGGRTEPDMGLIEIYIIPQLRRDELPAEDSVLARLRKEPLRHPRSASDRGVRRCSCR